MRVLLKEGATEATGATILVLPVCSAGMFETLAGERVPQGTVAEADPKVVVASASSAAKERGNPFVTSKDLLMDLTWLDKELGDYEEGARVSAQFSGGAYVLGADQRKKVECAEELAEGDAVAISPLNGLINARGHVVSVAGKWVEVEVDPGDRDRFESRTGLLLGEPVTVSFTSVEKLAGVEGGVTMNTQLPARRERFRLDQDRLAARVITDEHFGRNPPWRLSRLRARRRLPLPGRAGRQGDSRTRGSRAQGLRHRRRPPGRRSAPE
jgi:hypothetical protein